MYYHVHLKPLTAPIIKMHIINNNTITFNLLPAFAKKKQKKNCKPSMIFLSE